MRDAGAEAWVKMMLQVVTSDEYAAANSAMLDAYLTTSAPFRKLVETMMVQFVTSEAYTRAMRELLDTYLPTSAPFREALQTTMIETLTQLGATPGVDPATIAARFDPTGMWRGMRDTNAQAWSTMLASMPFQQSLETTMAQALTQLNMPTRADVSTLAERLDHIETRLDEIEAKIDSSKPARRSASGPAK
jgi:hypothetical protein